MKSSNPFLLFTSSVSNQSTLEDTSLVWQDVLQGWKLQLQNSAHGTFSDLVLLPALFGIDQLPGAKKALEPALGSTDGEEAMGVILQGMIAFFGGMGGWGILGKSSEG